MANSLISFTITSSGLKTILGVGFNPNKLKFDSAAKNGSASQLSVMNGRVDAAGNQQAKLDYYGPTAYAQESFADRCIHIREHNGSAWVTVLVASFDSYVTDGFKINVTTYNGGSSYQIRGEAEIV